MRLIPAWPWLLQPCLGPCKRRAALAQPRQLKVAHAVGAVTLWQFLHVPYPVTHLKLRRKLHEKKNKAIAKQTGSGRRTLTYITVNAILVNTHDRSATRYFSILCNHCLQLGTKPKFVQV